MLHPWGIITFYTLFKTLFTTGMSQPCIHRGKHPSLPAPTHKHLHTAHSPALLCWMHNTCNEIMFPVGMAVAGGWRCALNINVTTPRLAGSIGVMVGGKWTCGSKRSFIPLPKAKVRSPHRKRMVFSLAQSVIMNLRFICSSWWTAWGGFSQLV